MREAEKTKQDLIKEIEILKNENIRLAEEFQQKEKLFQKIIDAIPVVIFWSDKNHKLLGFNKKYIETVKKPRKQLIGKMVYELLPESSNIKEKGLRVINEENIFTSPESRLFKINKIPIKNKGKVSGVIYFSTDISEFKETENELEKYKTYLNEMAENRLNELNRVNNRLEKEVAKRNQVEEDLQNCLDSLKTCGHHLEACENDLGNCESNLSKTSYQLTLHKNELEQITYASSHFLQEPLRLIASYSQLLQKRYKGKLDDQADEFINYVVSNASRISNLINAHISFAKVNLSEKNFESTDLNTVVKNVLLEMGDSINDNRAKIVCEPLPVIMCDKFQFYQLFENIIGNALKFEGNKRIEVRIKAEKRANEWLFSIKDNGMGLKKEYFDRIFIMFNRLHSEEKYPGTGIGLTICKSIVQRHGGKIWVESNSGEGSTFFFTVPDNNL
jgi:PAS domain S-box-containing protein